MSSETLLHPIVSAARRSDVKLAGNPSIGLNEVDVLGRSGKAASVAFSELKKEAQQRLVAPRAMICGLTMDRLRIMGILNVTPDSFSDGGTLNDVAQAVARAKVMAADADILDIGGESTRPGAQEVAISDEIERVVPVIQAIRDAGITTPISIDTRKAAVAAAALAAGADIVNDVSALRFDPEMATVVAEADCPVCLMHSKGLPDTMQDNPDYGDVLFEVFDHLHERIDFAIQSGIQPERIITDPGIGFGKNLLHNVTLLHYLTVFHDLGAPILLGASRKRFIGTLTKAELASDRVIGSVAVALHGFAQGVQITRVHDVKETRQALDLHIALSEAL